MDTNKLIASELKLSEKQVSNVIDLLESGATIPFIARYRKEKTDSLDEEKIALIQTKHEYFVELKERKEAILKRIQAQNKLSDSLKKKIEETFDRVALEDLYEPYKIKKKTKAQAAREKGLEPLSELFLNQEEEDLEKLATPFISEEKAVKTAIEAIDGAMNILAEQIAENFEWKSYLREKEQKSSLLKSVVAEKDSEKKTKFEMYYDYSEKTSTIPSHRVLAIRRGEKDGILKTSIEMADEENINYLKEKFLKANFKTHARYVTMVEDSYYRLIRPSIENEIRNQLKKQADEEAFKVFSKNLRNILLSAPAGHKVIMGVDPGFRSGTKLAVIDKTGKFLEQSTIYPVMPQNQVEASKTILLAMIEKFNVEIIAIGNGTASREIDEFVGNSIKEMEKPPIKMVVNESGASVYSASAEARKEFPDLDVLIRGAISIARRVQDPLSEFVKIEPKSIGVGQYQHDVNQSELKKRLDLVVESCVNSVGVDLNTASESLLKHVSGISSSLAKAIVMYRDKHGHFKSRASMVKVPQFGPKSFEQAAGFLRVINSENPLDGTAVHPESYGIVTSICEKESIELPKLIGNKDVIQKIDFTQYTSPLIGLPTLMDIKGELEQPARDPRREFSYAQFNPKIKNMEDLVVGDWVEAAVTNVTDFGVFVDLGVHQDGMIHISELGAKYNKNLQEEFLPGKILKVRVLAVQMEPKRISLSLKQPGEAKKFSQGKKGKFQRKKRSHATLDQLKAKFDGKSKEKSNNVKLKISIKSIMKSGR